MKQILTGIVLIAFSTLKVSGQQWQPSGNDIYYSSGNIGINTSAPQSKLHIAGNNTTTGAPVVILQNYLYAGLIGSLRFASGHNNFDSWSGIEAYTPGGVDQQDLRFYTAYGSRNERMRINEHGQVGIGVTAPLGQLHIKGSAWGTSLLIQNNGGTEVFRVSDNGFVSVGTSAPADKFHVEGGGIVCAIGASSLQLTPGSGGIEIANGVNPWTFIDFKGSSNTTSDFRGRIIHDDNAGFSFITGGSISGMNISNSGFIGMGTNAPLAKLDVRGNVFCDSKILIGTTDITKAGNYSLAVNGDAIFNRVKIQKFASWADFVFEEKYRLLPLEEVEKFITANKHLPEVPTAAEVEKDGLDIGSTQTILLQKIEELTLYAIEQNKKATAQQEQINLLLKELTLLKEQQKK